jgi:hypothetical protein
MSSKQRLFVIIGISVAVLVAGGWTIATYLQRAWKGELEESRQTYAAGQELGSSISADQCVDTAYARHASAGAISLREHLNEGVFLEACLRASEPTIDCDTIPFKELRGSFEFNTWSIQQCHLHGLDDRGCHQVFQAVLHYCTRAGSRRGA